MRLSTLNPRMDNEMVQLDCPIHGNNESCHWGGRISVMFLPRLDGAKSRMTDRLHWNRTGDTIETLTLTPSVNCVLTPGDGSAPIQDWHGFITNGEVTSC